MRRLLLVGRSEAGKTTLAQALLGRPIKYEKTQSVDLRQYIIDTPGEYAQTAQYGRALAQFAYEADLVALVVSADEPYMLFSPNICGLVNREVIGIVTGIDRPGADPELVTHWLRLAGCTRIFRVSPLTGEGIDRLLEYLEDEK